jgi:hypothetical protein
VQSRSAWNYEPQNLNIANPTRYRKTETIDIAKYFVPASEIAAFLPADLTL